MKINNFVMKSDFGMNLFYLITMLIIRWNNLFVDFYVVSFCLMMIDVFLTLIILFFMFRMFRAVNFNIIKLRREFAYKVMLILLGRGGIEIYKILTILILYFANYNIKAEINENKIEAFCLIAVCNYLIILVIVDSILILLMFISSFKTVANFGKGLKEMLISQKKMSTNIN